MNRPLSLPRRRAAARCRGPDGRGVLSSPCTKKLTGISIPGKPVCPRHVRATGTTLARPYARICPPVHREQHRPDDEPKRTIRAVRYAIAAEYKPSCSISRWPAPPETNWPVRSSGRSRTRRSACRFEPDPGEKEYYLKGADEVEEEIAKLRAKG